MYKVFDYECPDCGIFEVLVKGYVREQNCECGKVAPKVISTPAIHNLETHLKGTNLLDSHGGYFDHNLRDRKTGEAPYITSLEQKKKILKERGYTEVGPTDVSRDRERSRKKPTIYH
jgi:hypothetical protein